MSNNKQQNATKPEDKKKEKEKDFKFQGYHYKAIEKRYHGKSYLEISTELSAEFNKAIRHQTVRRWFMRGGILESEYVDYCSKENDRRQKAMFQQMKKIVIKIPAKFDELLERQIYAKDKQTGEIVETGIKQCDMVTVQTLKLIVEMLGLKEAPKDGEDPLDAYFDRLESRHKNDADNESI